MQKRRTSAFGGLPRVADPLIDLEGCELSSLGILQLVPIDKYNVECYGKRLASRKSTFNNIACSVVRKGKIFVPKKCLHINDGNPQVTAEGEDLFQKQS